MAGGTTLSPQALAKLQNGIQDTYAQMKTSKTNLITTAQSTLVRAHVGQAGTASQQLAVQMDQSLGAVLAALDKLTMDVGNTANKHVNTDDANAGSVRSVAGSIPTAMHGKLG